jgi:hypothetical protein
VFWQTCQSRILAVHCIFRCCGQNKAWQYQQTCFWRQRETEISAVTVHNWKKTLLKLRFYSVYYSEDINATLTRCVLVRHYSSQKRYQGKTLFYFSLTCVWQLQSCETYISRTKPLCSATEQNWAPPLPSESLWHLTCLHKILQRFLPPELCILCDTILMYSGLSPAISISICFTEKDTSFCLICNLYQRRHCSKESCICHRIFLH